MSKLSGELHQRDLAVAALSGSASGVNQQLRREAERAEQKAAELKVSPRKKCFRVYNTHVFSFIMNTVGVFLSSSSNKASNYKTQSLESFLCLESLKLCDWLPK